MSGHSKWSTIKHKKALKDARRGKLFTKLIKDLTIAARIGGSDLGSNPRLRTALAAAKAASIPTVFHRVNFSCKKMRASKTVIAG